MSIDRDELHELVDMLPGDQLVAAVNDLRGRLSRPRASRTAPPYAWIGMGVTKDGVTDISMNTDHYLALGFGQDSL